MTGRATHAAGKAGIRVVRKPAGGASRRPLTPPRRRFEIDRIIVLRGVLALVLVAFFGLTARIALQAFGGGAEREVKRIERAVSETPAPVRAGAATPAPQPQRP